LNLPDGVHPYNRAILAGLTMSGGAWWIFLNGNTFGDQVVGYGITVMNLLID
jgi:hypothetical protein